MPISRRAFLGGAAGTAVASANTYRYRTAATSGSITSGDADCSTTAGLGTASRDRNYTAVASGLGMC